MPVDIMAALIDEYGGTVTVPPESAFDKIEIYTISEIEIGVDFNLWFDNERSDLTLIAGFKEIDGVIRYSVDDIHIL